MNKEDITRMGHDSGLCDANGEDDDSVNISRYLERFAKLVAEAEREACAKVAQETVCDKHIPTGYEIYGTKVAKAIRARGKE
jgi:hypothetical protein